MEQRREKTQEKILCFFAPLFSRKISLGESRRQRTHREFIVLTMRAYGIASGQDPTDNFIDAGQINFWAKEAKIKKLNRLFSLLYN
jgi:hypothetical protein